MNNTAEQVPHTPISVCKYPFKSYKEAYSVLKVDYSRYKKRMPRNLFDMLRLYVRNHGFSFTFWMRLSGVKGVYYPVCKIMHKRKMTKYGIQIESNTRIGEGLYIGHGFIIVNSTAKIGAGAVVIKDVPAYATAVGVPARNIIKE